jgi:hypothetical protein
VPQVRILGPGITRISTIQSQNIRSSAPPSFSRPSLPLPIITLRRGIMVHRGWREMPQPRYAAGMRNVQLIASPVPIY